MVPVTTPVWQKIQHYHARSTEERRIRRKNAKSRFFYFARCVGAYINLRYYSCVIHSFHWKSAIEHDSGACLKCVIVYLACAFVMYCVYGASCSSLLIESMYGLYDYYYDGNNNSLFCAYIIIIYVVMTEAVLSQL